MLYVFVIFMLLTYFSPQIVFFVSAAHPMGCWRHCFRPVRPSVCVYAVGGILRPACRRLLVILYCIRSNAVQVTTLLLAMFVCNKYVYLWLVTLKRVCVCDVTLTFQIFVIMAL